MWPFVKYIMNALKVFLATQTDELKLYVCVYVRKFIGHVCPTLS